MPTRYLMKLLQDHDLCSNDQDQFFDLDLSILIHFLDLISYLMLSALLSRSSTSLSTLAAKAFILAKNSSMSLQFQFLKFCRQMECCCLFFAFRILIFPRAAESGNISSMKIPSLFCPFARSKGYVNWKDAELWVTFWLRLIQFNLEPPTAGSLRASFIKKCVFSFSIIHLLFIGIETI